MAKELFAFVVVLRFNILHVVSEIPLGQEWGQGNGPKSQSEANVLGVPVPSKVEAGVAQNLRVTHMSWVLMTHPWPAGLGLERSNLLLLCASVSVLSSNLCFWGKAKFVLLKAGPDQVN